jgi:dihydrofolate reductase
MADPDRRSVVKYNLGRVAKAATISTMRKLVVLTFISLDGVMQAPGGKGEDPSGDFEFEGWTVPYADEAMGQVMGKQMGQPFDMLLGKNTYDIFAGYWPHHTGQIADAINKATKYVVAPQEFSTDWEKTVQIHENAADEIKKLKAGDGPMLQVHGSGNMIQTLFKHDLVDELWLKIYPVVLGKGKRLFAEGTMPAAYKLLESTTTPSGVIIASYQRDGEVQTGTMPDPA